VSPPRVDFVFASRGIGGAERSMLRLIGRTHPASLRCRVILSAPENRALRGAVASLGAGCHSLAAWDLPGLYRLLRSDPPDVLYAFGRFRNAGWAAVARMAGVRCVVAAERSAANRVSDRLARRLDRPLVTAYLANSRAAAGNLERIVGEGGPPVWVVPNGVDCGPPPVEVGRPQAAPSVLCVGNVSDNKGQLVLLEAVRRLQVVHPGLRATLIGRDHTGGAFSRVAAMLGLEDTYVALGFVADVRPHLDSATVVVLPTLHREGMPASLLEAMAAGVPVVATRVGGVDEIVGDGATGLLVPPGDPGALAGALARLLGDPELRRRLAGRARRDVVERHGLEVMVQGHLEAFARALALSPPATPQRSRDARPQPATVAHVTTAARSLRYLLLNQLEAVRSRGYQVSGVSAPGGDAAVLGGLGFRHEAVPMTRRFTPFADLLSLWRLYRLMRRRRFTIVHTHTPKPGLLGQIAARLAGVPVVVNTVHGFYFHPGMPRWARLFHVTLEKIAARCSDLVLSQNEEDVETAIRERIVEPGRIRHLGNGIDLRRFDPQRLGERAGLHTRAALGIAAEAPVVGFVGRMVAEKGVRDLMEAFRLVRERLPESRLLLVGGSDPEKTDGVGVETARELGVAAACVFTGVRQDTPELYAAMDVLALPSYREGFPRAPLEAAAMGVPCVVTDVRGCRQAVAGGRTGLLVAPGDVVALAGALLALLLDRELARRLGREGRRRALREFDERRVFATVLSHYERLLREKGLADRIPARPERHRRQERGRERSRRPVPAGPAPGPRPLGEAR
jgi:glycosyltransferase involved in cell wall biosynthesis